MVYSSSNTRSHDNVTQATPGHWTTVQSGSPGLPLDLPDRLTALDDIEGWWVGNSYFVGTNTASIHSAHWISTWLRSGRFLHPITQTLFGGPYGVVWAVLVLLRMHSTHVALTNNLAHPYPKRYKLTCHQTSLLEEDTWWLLGLLLQSVTAINTRCLLNLETLNMETPDKTQFQCMEKYVGEHRDVSRTSTFSLMANGHATCLRRRRCRY